MAAGEAHWQNGIVERHIGTFRELLNKLLLEDVFEGAENQSIVDNVCEAKNRNGTYHGTSPSQWLLGRSRHPLIDTSEASPMITKGSAFEEHLARKTIAAHQFHAADAKHPTYGGEIPTTGDLTSTSRTTGLLLPSWQKESGSMIQRTCESNSRGTRTKRHTYDRMA